MSLNLNSLNGNAPAPVNAPTGGPPIAVIVIVVLVIVGIIVGVVMATRPTPKSQPPAPTPPPPATTPPPPATTPKPPVPVPAAISPKEPGGAIAVTKPVEGSSINWIKKDNVAHYLGDSSYAKKTIGTVSGTVDECKNKCAANPECTHFNFIAPKSCKLFNGAEWVGSQPGSTSYCRSQCQT